MKIEKIKNKKKQIIGYIETDYKKRKLMRDKERNIIAYYYPRTNMTKDQYHNDVGEGNRLNLTLMKKLKAEYKKQEKTRVDYGERRWIIQDED